jgi:NAD(P)H-dependent flavin oxidoreductase YrpB (nitropropane dioxygenase family)
MLRTRFTELVGCTVPIQQAPIGGCASPRLAAAVAEAGGLGMVSVTGDPPEIVATQLDQARQLSAGPIGAHFFLLVTDPDSAPESVAVAAERVPVVDFFYADPDPKLVDIVHAAGALASWQIGSVEEARAAADAGCDFVIAQGIEAGGHGRGQIGVLALLDAVLSAVDVPVLAAGGIGSGRALAAVLAAGADGARIGTRFVAAEEAEAHPRYVEALIASRPSDTVRSDTFALDYPGAPHRALRSSVDAAQAFQGDVVGEFVDPTGGARVPVRRFQKLTITRHMSGAIEAMPHWAGESVRGVTRVQPAAEIVRELAGEAEHLLCRWGPQDGPSTGS